ncbi:fusion protein [Belerina virus]|uniref:Fusion glycoprotein F0 n=1 Tax=Belerina virus TaxID=2748342 RepID=A0A7D5DLW3_9MONO|nr:fusion protein [Belerina virus]QKZ93216.1 fusion protein [Belerina virus]
MLFQTAVQSLATWALLILLSPYLDHSTAQVGFSELSKIGIIKARSYLLKTRGAPITQPIVVKLMPNLKNFTGCGQQAVADYKSLLNNILLPINASLVHMQNAISSRVGGVRFWGAVIGGVALGVATAAQVTAGVALHNTKQNAADIWAIKKAMLETNDAIHELQTASAQTVLLVSGIQEQINNQIVPAINTLGCQVAENTLALTLSRYFSELSLVFGPNLRDPATETLSIQAISNAFNGDFESLLKNLGYSSSDFLDVLESQLIRGRIIGVDTEDYLIIIQVEYPSITQIKDAVVQTFNLISFSHEGVEWMPVFPRQILVRMNLVSNIDTEGCVYTSTSVICESDTSTPVSIPLLECIHGNTSHCIITRSVNSHVSRYALSDGVLFANCLPMLCQCQTTGKTIIQEYGVASVMITKEMCPEVYIDGFYIQVGPRVLNRTLYASNYSLGGQVSIDPVDIGSEISQIQTHLNNTQQLLDKSSNILNSIDHYIMSIESIPILIAMCVIIFLWLIGLTCAICCYIRKVGQLNGVPWQLRQSNTVNSLSSLIPQDK